MFFFSLALSSFVSLFLCVQEFGVGCWAITFFTWISIWSKGNRLIVCDCMQTKKLKREKKSFSLDHRPSTTAYCIRNWDFHSTNTNQTGTDECSLNRFRVWYSFEIASQIQCIFVPLQHFALILFYWQNAFEPKNHKRILLMPHTRKPYTIRILCFFFLIGVKKSVG